MRARTRSRCCAPRVDWPTRAGFTVSHVDATVMLEAPKLAPVREAMRAKLAAALGLELAQVSVKATRGEGMGFVGQREGAAALAVATVQSADLSAALSPVRRPRGGAAAAWLRIRSCSTSRAS